MSTKLFGDMASGPCKLWNCHRVICLASSLKLVGWKAKANTSLFTLNADICLFTVHGAWSAWQTWSHCTVSCGGGQRMRTRLCDSPAPQNNGRPCIGFAEQSDYCNSEACPSKLGIGVETDHYGSVLDILITVGDGSSSDNLQLNKQEEEKKKRLQNTYHGPTRGDLPNMLPDSSLQKESNQNKDNLQNNTATASGSGDLQTDINVQQGGNGTKLEVVMVGDIQADRPPGRRVQL